MDSAVERRGCTDEAEECIRLRRGSGFANWLFGGEFGAVRGCAKSILS